MYKYVHIVDKSWFKYIHWQRICIHETRANMSSVHSFQSTFMHMLTEYRYSLPVLHIVVIECVLFFFITTHAYTKLYNLLNTHNLPPSTLQTNKKMYCKIITWKSTNDTHTYSHIPNPFNSPSIKVQYLPPYTHTHTHAAQG